MDDVTTTTDSSNKNQVERSSSECPPAPVIDQASPLAHFWRRPLCDASSVNLQHVNPELANDVVRERHRIYCVLLMALIKRFWNGNKNGPVGVYPRRANQKEPGQDPRAAVFRYRGDMDQSRDPLRVSWDRYLGHNIAALAVDGNGEVIDFDFNHNDLFRSSAEHAEARIVRRLFSLANVSDSWRTGALIPGKSRAFSLKEVTVYTSLESCAQCSGVMSLGRVKQVVYLQTDPGTYTIGNLMFNLAGQDPSDNSYLAAMPIPAASIGLEYFDELNAAYLQFYEQLTIAKAQNDLRSAFFVPQGGQPADFATSITSFLCTDSAYSIFERGAAEFNGLRVKDATATSPSSSSSWTNQQCLDGARRFYQYADVEGYRGSPHKL
jgi:tRNA(Arg) A34 adenosine deaminase TadA